MNKLKENYINIVRDKIKDIKKNMVNPYKKNTLTVLKELLNRIEKTKKGFIVGLSSFGESVFYGGNCEVMGLYLFTNPYNKKLYNDGFYYCVTNNNLYSIIKLKGGLKQK